MQFPTLDRSSCGKSTADNPAQSEGQLRSQGEYFPDITKKNGNDMSSQKVELTVRKYNKQNLLKGIETSM